MNFDKQSQRGEGKVGCIVSLVVILLLGAMAIKVVPVIWGNNELTNEAQDLAGRAAVIPDATILAQIRAKAREAEIQEALAPGAITVVKRGTPSGGTCDVSVKYSRKVDLYGVYDLTIETNFQKSVPYMDVR